jgi:hypothetical protein
MINLSATERKVFNNLSMEQKRTVKLGDKVVEIINNFPTEGTPVNAVNAKATLTLTGVVIDGETVTIGTDVYEFLADAAQTKTAATNIAVDISLSTTASSGTLTMDTQPTSGDTVTLGDKTYIFVPVGTDTADGEISIGADIDEAQDNFVKAVAGVDGVNIPHPLVRATPFENDESRIIAIVGGTVGDTIATTETFTAATNVFAANVLGSGIDCSASDAITALVAAITTSDTQGVGAAAGAGDTVVLTADVAGVAGNNITIAADMANGSFPAGVTKLSGGVDGTVGFKGQRMFDTTYDYVCIDANTIAGKNWRRVALGAAY